MSAGPVDAVNTQAGPSSGLSQLIDRIHSGGTALGHGNPFSGGRSFGRDAIAPGQAPPSNTGAAQFLSGPLRHTDFRQGITNIGGRPTFPGQGYGGPGYQPNPGSPPTIPRYNPDARPSMEGGPFQLGRRGLLDRRVM